MASQLPSPPETLTESLANSQSTLGSSTDDDAPASRPSTPQRGRLDPRFPSTLGPGRVPLHRRGTSKTYERMEDLLREAGYKETRVFTPETERAEAEAEERKERTLRRAASVRSGVDAVVGFISGLGEEDPSAAPPLPRTWLESVAHAVLFGGTGAHMGGPSAISPSASSRSPSQSHSQSRSPISRSRLDVLRQSPFSSTSALSDRTNVPRQIKSHPPPLLCAQVAAYRAPSDSRISRTQVVCHSAPGSRSGSRVRVPADWGLQVADRGRGKRSRGKPDPPRNQKDKGKPKGKDGMPTLANTHAHDDEWGKTSGDDGIYTSGSSSEDDDDGELDLARLLVPAYSRCLISARAGMGRAAPQGA
ncbi:hypothetical protein FIBSPDRAFT_885963 [Athelia psychrophila]|uniref:Uncharacterized protein n=1 Tax=Athelia psychrophila TaxID=1759441 RepID=A0A166RAI6_9AGAM|nr:hypothetical protein FIBSPDRAFT_885963 [Fibularhizoctonia sp. CBS 109695]